MKDDFILFINNHSRMPSISLEKTLMIFIICLFDLYKDTTIAYLYCNSYIIILLTSKL
jgi:hypothetical protein